MATYLSPGVYVEEVATGPKPIAGLPTNVASIVGMTERGPSFAPTRLSSWNDFIATFGSFVDGSYTPESVYGFFENGGSAIWVVRADDATTSTWNVIDGNGQQAFVISASSPGGWSAGMLVAAARDTGGGQGTLFSAAVTTDTNVPAGTAPFTVTVDTTAGAKTGMRVRLQDLDNQAQVDVVSIGSGQLTVKRAAAGSAVPIKAASGRLFAVAQAGATTLSLASGSGFANGDVLRALTPSGNSYSASVATALSTGVGMELTLGSDTFGSPVPGMELEARSVALTATVSGPTAPVAASDLVWPSGAPPNWDKEIRRAVTTAGDERTWGGANFPFTQPVPAGQVEVDVGLYVSAFSETFSPARMLSDADVASRYAFLPVGTQVRLTDDAANSYTITRSAGAPGFTNSGATGPFKTAGPFNYVSAAYQFNFAQGVVLQGPAAPEPGDWIDFGGGNRQQVDTVTAGGGAPANTFVVTFRGAPAGATVGTQWPVLAWQATRFQPLRFKLTAAAQLAAQTVSEEFGNLSLDPASRRYYAADGVINGTSTLIAVGPKLSATAADTIAALPVSVEADVAGAGGVLTGASLKQGVDALEVATEPALIACPDVLQLMDELEQADVLNHVTDHATRMRRFAVLDLPEKRSDQLLADFRLTYLDSTYAAGYAPFVRMINPGTNPVSQTVDIPPSGFVMGVFARTDNDRGVWKAPANERVSGVVGLSTQYTRGRQDFLNPLGINLLRAFPGRGTRIWGARNLTDDTDWRYVNVRRLFLMMENSIDAGTQWVVFEPNDANTWLRVRVSVENFLNGIWRAGGLIGSKPDEAYRVRVGLGQTMTETDIELGLLIIEVAAAPVRPAEFVVFRISQKRLTE